MDDNDRLLTDADVKAIANELKAGLLRDLYQEAGKGMLFWVRRIAILLLLLLAIYGLLGGERALVQSVFAAKGGE